MPAPDEGAAWWHHGLCDAQMLAMIRAQDHGLIHYNACGGMDLAWLIAQIALAYPQATLAVMVASVDLGHRLQRRIGRWIPKVAMLAAQPNTRPVGRVVIGTHYGLADHEVELNKRDIVIFPRAQDALQEHAQTALMTADPKFRVFGFLPTDCKLSPYQQDWIRATFGFAEVTIPRHGFVTRPVRTVWSAVEGGPRQQPGTSLLKLNRQCVWYHPVRNRRIAQLAAKISQRDTNWLRQRMPEVSVAASATATCRVLVLAEAVEHALNLADLLPDWPVIVGEGVIEVGLDSKQRRLLAERRAMRVTSGPVIATPAGLARPGALGLNTVDVLIWTGAGKQLPPVPAEMLVSCPAQARGLLVVDFNDRHYPQLQRWSRLRRRACLDAGWIALGDNPVRARIDQFLARRPGRRAAR